MESRLPRGPTIEADAPYVAEMVRNDMQAKYGDSIYTAGFRVYTTIDSRLERGGHRGACAPECCSTTAGMDWRGATTKVDPSKIGSARALELELEELPAIGGLRPAIVESTEDKSAKIYVKGPWGP